MALAVWCLAVVTASACSARSGAGDMPTRVAPVPTAVPGGAAVAATAVQRGGAPGAGRWWTEDAVRSAEGVTATVATVPFAADLAAFPGPWAPTGASLVAFVRPVTTTEAPDPRPLRVWTVDAETARPLWDSGDVEDAADATAWIAAWADDDTLVLPRAHDPWVGPDGSVAVAVEGVDGQPRRVDVAPDGQTAFVEGVDGAWLVSVAGDARALYGRPDAGFAAWSWRDDAAMLAAMGRDGGLYVVDVESAAAEMLADFSGQLASPDGAGPPRWAVDGSILFSEALVVPSGGGAALDHRLVDPDGGEATSVAARLGMVPNRDMPGDASDWLSPDGAWLLYPEIGAEASAGVPVRWWLYDVRDHDRLAAPEMADPRWSPTGVAVAHLDPSGALAVWRLFDGRLQEVVPASAGLRSFAWSPSGRWLSAVDERGGLWLAAADGSAGPSRVAGPVASGMPPTWSPDEERIAVSTAGPDGVDLAILALRTIP